METKSTETSIVVKNLNFSYPGHLPAINDISFECKKKQAIGLIGANGAGKSTMLKLLVGLEDGFNGEINICGHQVNKSNIKHVREHIGYVFQDSDSQLFMTRVEDDIAFAPRNYGLDEEEVEKRVQAALGAVHIEHLRGRAIHKLSGGEKKLASLATILSTRPDILLLDEPSVALDPKNRKNLIKVINELDELKIIASHDLDFIMDTCERVMLINSGRIIKDGDCIEVLTDERVLVENGLELPLSMSRKNLDP